MTAVADDVAPGVGAGAARLLRRHRREQAWIEAELRGGARYLGREGHALLCKGTGAGRY
jgi:hypothetical protein